MAARWLQVPPWELAAKPAVWLSLTLAAMRIASSQPPRAYDRDEAMRVDRRKQQAQNTGAITLPDAQRRQEAANNGMQNFASTAGPTGGPDNMTTPNRRGLQSASMRKRARAGATSAVGGAWDDYSSEASLAPNLKEKQ